MSRIRVEGLTSSNLIPESLLQFRCQKTTCDDGCYEYRIGVGYLVNEESVEKEEGLHHGRVEHAIGTLATTFGHT